MSQPQVVGTLVTLAVICAIAAGIFLLGSPADERSRRLDERRAQDLSGIARAIDLFWTRNNSSLPASLEVLRNSTGAGISVADPDTKAPYEFRSLEGDRYELCAAFEGASTESDRGFDAGFWSHPAGRHCFQRGAETVR